MRDQVCKVNDGCVSEPQSCDIGHKVQTIRNLVHNHQTLDENLCTNFFAPIYYPFQVFI